MKTNIFILAVTLLVLSLQSCVDSIPIPVEDVDAKLRFESNIGTFKGGFSAVITSTGGLNDISTLDYPKDLDVRITWDTDDFAVLLYEESCNCYVNDLETPSISHNYTLVASSPNDIYEDIMSTMRIPARKKAANLEAIRHIADNGMTSVSSTLQIDASANANQYYHIIPFRKGTDIIGDTDQEEVYNEYIEYLELESFNNPLIHIERLSNRPGFLVNFKEEDIAETPLNLELISNDFIDYESEAFTKIFYEIRTVTDYYYEYEKYLSTKLEWQSSGANGNPPIVPTNIINGLGYFGGYSVAQDSVALQ